MTGERSYKESVFLVFITTIDADYGKYVSQLCLQIMRS
ncbi:hypothetical protein MNBD_GAMMA07-1836 [hydrothermal vent metagenome]|uniref:Uncharacterized protein n=1 Tax=hydrothermal vent metagenome TaxID=652676 RepID=A0A3B0WN53_9ZZZZ